MILYVSFKVSADIGKITAFTKAFTYHLFNEPGSRLAVIGNTEDDTSGTSHGFLFEYCGGNYVKQILFIIGKHYEMHICHPDTADQLPFYRGQLGLYFIRQIRLIDKSNHWRILSQYSKLF